MPPNGKAQMLLSSHHTSMSTKYVYEPSQWPKLSVSFTTLLSGSRIHLSLSLLFPIITKSPSKNTLNRSGHVKHQMKSQRENYFNDEKIVVFGNFMYRYCLFYWLVIMSVYFCTTNSVYCSCDGIQGRTVSRRR